MLQFSSVIFLVELWRPVRRCPPSRYQAVSV